MAEFRRERSHDLWGEISPLLEEHWKEIATFNDIPLDPDVERYNAIEDAGGLRCYTVRVKGRLVGYAVFAITGGLHYKSSKMAWQDVLFVLPEYRVGRIGAGLILYTESELAKEGVLAIYHHEKLAAPQLGLILRRIGYQTVENIWVKRLGEK